MSVENQGYDPNRAELGVHNREGYSPGHKPPNEGGHRAAVPRHEVGGGFGIGEFADEDWNRGRAAAMKIGMDKEALDQEFMGEYAPENIVWPQFPEPGEDYRPGERHSSPNTDLEAHGFHEHPKPSPAKLIRERLRNQRAQMFHNQKKEVQEDQEEQDEKHDAFKAYPTDVDVDRNVLDISRSGYLTKQGHLTLLEEQDANAIKIMLVLDQAWEEDWREWEPETILQTLEQEGVEIAKINLDKIMALKVLLNTLEFWNSPRTFEKVCLAFAGRMVDWGHIQEPRVHDIAACVALVERYIAEHEFSDDVAAYVAGSAVRDGYVLLPPTLSFAEFPFSNELAFSMGDQVLDVQTQLMDALEQEADIPREHGVQYMRLLRCQYHIQDMIDQAKA